MGRYEGEGGSAEVEGEHVAEEVFESGVLVHDPQPLDARVDVRSQRSERPEYVRPQCCVVGLDQQPGWRVLGLSRRHELFAVISGDSFYIVIRAVGMSVNLGFSDCNRDWL